MSLIQLFTITTTTTTNMAQKNNNGGGQKEGGDNKKKNNVTVVLKVDLHCDGCASKVFKCLRSVDGVETVMADEGQNITVVGNMEPAKLREKVEQRTRKKVELISPQPKKAGGDNRENEKGKDKSSGEKEKKNEPKEKQSSKDKSQQKKSKEKELPVTTTVFKMNLHCDGCIGKIYKTISKAKGYEDMKIDGQKDLVTVTGAVDAKALSEALSKHLKRDVAIVPAKKEGEKKEGGGGGEKAKNGGDGGKTEGTKMQAVVGGYPYPFMPGMVVIGDTIHYNPYPPYEYHAAGIFSDENPNACSVM